jgi:hypothetical protein
VDKPLPHSSQHLAAVASHLCPSPHFVRQGGQTLGYQKQSFVSKPIWCIKNGIKIAIFQFIPIDSKSFQSIPNHSNCLPLFHHFGIF